MAPEFSHETQEEKIQEAAPQLLQETQEGLSPLGNQTLWCVDHIAVRVGS